VALVGIGCPSWACFSSAGRWGVGGGEPGRVGAKEGRGVALAAAACASAAAELSNSIGRAQGPQLLEEALDAEQGRAEGITVTCAPKTAIKTTEAAVKAAARISGGSCGGGGRGGDGRSALGG
jgi:hypothetical protein